MSTPFTPYVAGAGPLNQPTATSIQIGNSDDRLTQREWCDFINAVMKIMRRYRIWFSGPSEARAPWQCFCWVIDGKLTSGDEWELRTLAGEYRQNQIAMTTGTTIMLTPASDAQALGRNNRTTHTPVPTYMSVGP